MKLSLSLLLASLAILANAGSRRSSRSYGGGGGGGGAEETRYLQELSAHWSSSKGAEVEGPTASMSRSVASSAALSMSSSAQQ